MAERKLEITFTGNFAGLDSAVDAKVAEYQRKFASIGVAGSGGSATTPGTVQKAQAEAVEKAMDRAQLRSTASQPGQFSRQAYTANVADRLQRGEITPTQAMELGSKSAVDAAEREAAREQVNAAREAASAARERRRRITAARGDDRRPGRRGADPSEPETSAEPSRGGPNVPGIGAGADPYDFDRRGTGRRSFLGRLGQYATGGFALIEGLRVAEAVRQNNIDTTLAGRDQAQQLGAMMKLRESLGSIPLIGRAVMYGQDPTGMGEAGVLATMQSAEFGNQRADRMRSAADYTARLRAGAAASSTMDETARARLNVVEQARQAREGVQADYQERGRIDDRDIGAKEATRKADFARRRDKRIHEIISEHPQYDLAAVTADVSDYIGAKDRSYIADLRKTAASARDAERDERLGLIDQAETGDGAQIDLRQRRQRLAQDQSRREESRGRRRLIAGGDAELRQSRALAAGDTYGAARIGLEADRDDALSQLPDDSTVQGLLFNAFAGQVRRSQINQTAGARLAGLDRQRDLAVNEATAVSGRNRRVAELEANRQPYTAQAYGISQSAVDEARLLRSRNQPGDRQVAIDILNTALSQETSLKNRLTQGGSAQQVEGGTIARGFNPTGTSQETIAQAAKSIEQMMQDVRSALKELAETR